MPTQKGVLTGAERVFVERYAATGDGVYAAEKAGYAYPAQAAHQNLAKPAIQGGIARNVSQRLDRMVPKLMQRLEKIIDDPDTPAKQIIDMSKSLLPFWKGDSSGEAKELHEMTFDELQASILAGNARLAALQAEQNVIEHQPAPPEPEPEAPAETPESGIFG